MLGRRPRGSLEGEVLAVVAGASGPVTTAQVTADLSGTAAYTTVMTTLNRLCDKGALTRRRHGRSYEYALATAPESVDAARAARQMRRLLDAQGSRDDVLARFVAELDPAEEEVLRHLLQPGSQ